MDETIRILLGILILLAGIPIGNFLAKITKEELSQGQIWFKLIVLTGFTGSIVSLILRNDVLFFTFLFIVIITSRSLKQGRRK